MRTIVSGVRNLKDAWMLIENGVDGLGFVLEPSSPSYVNPETAREIIEKLPPAISTIGVFSNSPRYMIQELTTFCRLDWLLFFGNEKPEDCKDYFQPIIKFLPGLKFHDSYKDVKAFLIDNEDEKKQSFPYLIYQNLHTKSLLPEPFAFYIEIDQDGKINGKPISNFNLTKGFYIKEKANIAIDGPAGAGKSTVAKLVAKNLKLDYIDTGAMYRALTWKALKTDTPFKEEFLKDLTKKTRISFIKDEVNSGQKIFCDGLDVTDKIREPKVSQHVSLLASFPGVREQLTQLQRERAKAGGVVMDGRDIGTYVLPNAEFKFFLTASIDARSNRRYQELKNKGLDIDFKEIKSEIIARDKADADRDFAPMAIAKDAKLIDTTNLSIEEVVNIIVAQYKE